MKSQRVSATRWLVGCVALAAAACSCQLTPQLASADDDPAARPVRLMINWDEQSMWRFQLEVKRRNGEELDAEAVRRFIQETIDEQAKAKIDRIAYCAWARFGSPIPGFESCDFEEGSYARAPGFDKLHESSTNQLEVALERCREHEVQFLVCLRMNDRHGVAQTAKFYVENPELRLEGYPGGLDYKYDEVRGGVLAFIEEVLQRYDIDGIELDYQRWCHMFRSEEAEENTHLLTDMMRKARALVDGAAKRRGRERLLLSARVPQTLVECQRLGMDVKTWVQEGLLDYVCPSDFFFSDFNMRVDRYVELCKGTRCQVYPAIHPLIQVNHPDNIGPANYRALAKNYYADGASGIATYNFQYNWVRMAGGDRGLVDGWPKTLTYMTQLREPAELLNRDRHYLYYPLWQTYSPSGAMKYNRLVLDRKAGSSDPFGFRMFENDASPSTRFKMQFRARGIGEDERLAVQINGHDVPGDSVKRTFDEDGLRADEGRPAPPFFLHEFPLQRDGSSRVRTCCLRASLSSPKSDRTKSLSGTSKCLSMWKTSKMRPTPCSRRAFFAGTAGMIASSRVLSDDDRANPTFTFKKTGMVVLPRGAPDSYDSTHAKYPCVLKVGEDWMMWYSGRGDDSFTGSIGLATSRDGLKWTKVNSGRPVLGPGGPGSADETKADHPAVVHFDGRFHMWYTAGPRDSRYRICYATSDDGYRWERENGGRPVLGPGDKGRFDDQVVLHPAVVRDPSGLLHMWYNGVGPQKDFLVGHATSRDGIHWERQNGGAPVLTPSTVSGREEIYVYNVMVLLENGVYHMWYSSALDITPWGRFALYGNGIVYANSRDGTNWKRDDAVTLLSGDAGAPDAYACFAPYVVRRGDSLWMYYSMGSAYQRYTTGLAMQQ